MSHSSSDGRGAVSAPWFQPLVTFSNLWLSFARGSFTAVFKVRKDFSLVFKIVNIIMVSLLPGRTSLPCCLRVAFYTGWGFSRDGARVGWKQQKQLGARSFWACEWEMFPKWRFRDVSLAWGDDTTAEIPRFNACHPLQGPGPPLWLGCFCSLWWFPIWLGLGFPTYMSIYIYSFPPKVYLACPVTVLNRHFCCCCSLQRAWSLSLPHPTKLWHSCPGH